MHVGFKDDMWPDTAGKLAAMLSILQGIFDRVVHDGNLTVVDSGGRAYRYGSGTGTPVTMRLTDRKIEWQLATNPHLHMGEGYMDGRIVFDEGRVYDFLETMLSNAVRFRPPRWLDVTTAMRYATRLFRQFNPVGRARRNVAHHYDLDRRLYDLFLDDDLQYSCAYFQRPDATLGEAQTAKLRHIAAKLALADGQKVLDIGSGWGGMALYLASCAEIAVTGVTLSEEQLRVSLERRRKLGLDARIDFRLQDYRHINETFDRIVSVGMFEHVGVVHYPTYFRRVRELLAEDGVAVIHSIGRSDGPGTTNAWIEKYIFPGGYIPALSEVVPAIEESGLYITDIEILRLHYADTLRHWRHRFLDKWDQVADIYDERFCRMWEFYLAASETAFRYEGMMVLQIQLTKHQHALPLTRDYMLDWERERMGADAGGSTERRLAGE